MHKTLPVLLGLGCLFTAAGLALATPEPGQQRLRQVVPDHPSTGAPSRRLPTVPGPAQPQPAILGEQELLIASQVHTGRLPCELGQTLRLEADARWPGYFSLQGPGFRFHMRPVLSRTGTIRLEDEKAGAVWLQLADKSMLMDHQRGRRLADACAHPQQLAAAAQMKHQPPPALFDTKGMGRED